MWKRRLSLLFLLNMAGSFALVCGARALTVNPLRQMITMDPGAVANVKINIYNNQDTAVNLALAVLGGRQDESGRPIFIGGTDAAERWVTPSVNSARLAPRGRTALPFTISVPSDAAPGSHYLGLAVEQTATGEDGAAIGARLISILALQVAGVVKENLTISPRLKSSWIFSSPVPLRLTLKNESNIEVPVSVVVSLTDRGGRVLQAPTVPAGNPLLSGAERILEPLITIDKEKLLGWYRLEVKATYGQTRQVSSGAISFWYFSQRLILVIGAVIFFGVGFLIWRLQKKRN